MPADAVDPHPVGDVFEDGLRKRIRLLKNEPDTPAQPDDVHAPRVDVLSVQQHLALHPGVRDQVVHSVQAPQKSGLPAAGRSDQGRDRPLRYGERDVEERLALAVEEVQMNRLDPDRADFCGSPFR